MIKARHEINHKNLVKRRDFLRGASGAVIAALTGGCNNDTKLVDTYQDGRTINPSSWWSKGGFIVHDTVDTRNINKNVVSAYVNGEWQKFKIVNLPERFINWSMKMRVARL